MTFSKFHSVDLFCLIQCWLMFWTLCVSDSISLNQAHKFAIQQCHTQLVDELCLMDTNLMDDLISKDALTPSEAASIRHYTSQRCQNKVFVECILNTMDYTTFQEVLLPAMRKDRGNYHIAESLSEALRHLNTVPPEIYCPYCCLLRDVDPKNVASFLLQKLAISPNLYRDLSFRGTMPRSKK